MLDYGQPSMYMSCLSSPHCTGIDCLIEPLRSTIQAKVKANAFKQEHENQEELKKSSLGAGRRTVSAEEGGGGEDRGGSEESGGGEEEQRGGGEVEEREGSWWRGTGRGSFLNSPSLLLLLL